jgi:hypothetical protein
MKELMETLYRIERGDKKYLKENDEQLPVPTDDMPLEELPPEEEPSVEVDPIDVQDLAEKLVSGEITYDEFKDSLAQLETGEAPEEIPAEDETAEPSVEDPYNQEYQGESLQTIKKLAENCIGECGEMGGMGMSSMPKQSDQVSMTVNMSGSGSGGIKDILNILRDIEDGSDHSARGMDSLDTMIISSDEPSEMEGFANAPDEKYSSIKDIMKSGNDMHRPKDSYSDAPYRGDNPMALKSKLESLYRFVKDRK